MEIRDTLSVLKEFTDTPGARYRSEGDFSGEEFLERLLRPRFEKAVKGGYILEIEIDGVWGYPSSFVSGSFGMLSIEKGANEVLKYLVFKSSNQTRIQKFIAEINDPQERK